MKGPPGYIYFILAASASAFQLSPIPISQTAFSSHHDRHSPALHAASEDDTTTSFTLSFGDVEFCLTPRQNMDDAMSISNINISNGEVLLDLDNFAGTLHVKNQKIIDASSPVAVAESDGNTDGVKAAGGRRARLRKDWSDFLKRKFNVNEQTQKTIDTSSAAFESDDNTSDDNSSGDDDNARVEVEESPPPRAQLESKADPGVEVVIVEAVLPPAQPESKAAQRFEAMLSNFRLHSEADINLVTSPRYRGLLTGTLAAINDPKVTLAFKVLYEDLGPVRVAGDLIFSKLEQELAKSKGSSGAMNVKALGRDDSCVVAARKIFDAVDADASGTVSSQELLDSDLLRSLGQCTECTCGKEGSCESVMRFMDEIDKTHPEGELHFDEFLLASHMLYEGDASKSLFGGDNSAEELVDEMLNGREGEIGQEKVDRYSKRFDAMCDEFDSWDSDDSSSKAQSSNPRLALVLEGCFAGSKNPPVVDALKILYVDFRPLRMAGDLIFKLMRKLAVG